MSNTRIVLASRPVKEPTAENFSVIRDAVPSDVPEGHVLVQVQHLSFDPAMRGWMNDQKSYVPPVALQSTMRAGGIGVVVASRDASVPVGAMVSGLLGWQHFAVLRGKDVTVLPKALPKGLSHTIFLGVLGLTGMTAYFGLLEVGKPKQGDTVLVSGAAGATGSVVGQIAKILGCRVVGIAGGDDKCRWVVKELGFDECINYKATKDLRVDIKKACPKGVDVFFDNVGGATLDAALTQINKGARVVICGAISQYNAGAVKGPNNYLSLLVNRARMEGFVVFDYAKQYPAATEQLLKWVVEGKLKFAEDVQDAPLTAAPAILMKLFDGSNQGKLIMKVKDAPAPQVKSRL